MWHQRPVWLTLARLRPTTYPAQLAVGLLLLLLAAILGAGAPAYWLARQQLTAQVEIQLADAHQATFALLQIEQNRLDSVAFLFAERPTLSRLLADGTPAALETYIRDFLTQLNIDLLVLCDDTGRALAGASGPLWAQVSPGRICPAPGAPWERLVWVEEGLLLVGRHPVLLSDTGDSAAQGVAVAGVWVDAPFLAQLVAATGLHHALRAPDGRLVSSLPIPTPALLTDAPRLAVLPLQGEQFFHAAAPVPTTLLTSHLLLPADAVLRMQARARAWLLGSTALLVGLGVGLGIWWIRRLLAPLETLTAAAQQVSQEHAAGARAFPTVPIPAVSGPAEVRTLAAALQRSQQRLLAALDDVAGAHDRLEALMQSLTEGVVTLDATGRITFWNQGAETITGWPAAHALGKTLAQVLPLATATPDAVTAQLPAAGQTRRLTVLTSGGKSTVIEVTGLAAAQPAAPPGGRPLALVLRDVTEEEAVRHLRAYFLANISHEFRTPLSTLNASIELLMDETQSFSPAEMRQLLQPIHLSLMDLQGLIDNLLESSTIEAGHFRVRRQPLRLNGVLHDAIRTVHPLLTRRHQTLSLTEPAVLPPLWADRVRLTQVLVNLLVNAGKYSPIHATIDLTVARLPAALRIAVADRGPGIPPAERANLFRRFVRLDARNEGEQGTGLGLYVVKTIVEAHGGQVGVDDRPGGGSIFWVELPLDTSADVVPVGASAPVRSEPV